MAHDNGVSLKEMADYKRFQNYLEKVCGIVVADNKLFLVNSRLKRVLKEREISGLSELIDKLESTNDLKLKRVIVDAMTTNETMWFRDKHPYNLLRDELLIALYSRINPSGRKDLRIWSAACSTGQEPYSISMIVDEGYAKGILPSDISVRIVATDISKKVIDTAKVGIYDRMAIDRGLPEHYLRKYFSRVNDNEHQVVEKIKERVDFRCFNLKENFVFLGQFDIIFCRNVLIYFSPELKMDILKRMHSALRPNGYLFLGASESLNSLPELYEMLQYRPAIVYAAKNQRPFTGRIFNKD